MHVPEEGVPVDSGMMVYSGTTLPVAFDMIMWTHEPVDPAGPALAAAEVPQL